MLVRASFGQGRLNRGRFAITVPPQPEVRPRRFGTSTSGSSTISPLTRSYREKPARRSTSHHDSSVRHEDACVHFQPRAAKGRPSKREGERLRERFCRPVRFSTFILAPACTTMHTMICLRPNTHKIPKTCAKTPISRDWHEDDLGEHTTKWVLEPGTTLVALSVSISHLRLLVDFRPQSLGLLARRT